MKAVVYARVSSREQEREGYSIPAQRKLLAEYAKARGFEVVSEFIDVESAKTPGRKEFGKMLRFLETDPDCRIVLVEKTDRLYRNRKDSLTFEELVENRNVEVHLVKEGRIIAKDSRSQDKFMHDIHVAVARNYSENLKEEVKKGMREKAEQGIYPAHAPFGYRNNRETRAIDINPEKAPILQRLFQLYGTGNYSLSALRKAIFEETGTKFARSYLESMLKNRFYLGYFVWQGIEYPGTHEPIIESSAFNRVQAVFAGHNKPRIRKHNFALAGLLRCAHCGCRITFELHKGKYVYCRCTFARGKCELPYIPEPRMLNQLGELLQQIYVPDAVAQVIVESIHADQGRAESERQSRADAIQQKLAGLRTRMDKMYEDKLDGRIDEDFWTRKMNDWREQERALQSALDSLSLPLNRDRALSVARILELAQRAYSLYLTRTPAEQGELLKSVLLNCATDGVSLWPAYKKPFDLIFQRAKNEEWSGREDLNLRPPGPEPGALPG
jgi:site-specific DNA recombinase